MTRPIWSLEQLESAGRAIEQGYEPTLGFVLGIASIIALAVWAYRRIWR